MAKVKTSWLKVIEEPKPSDWPFQVSLSLGCTTRCTPAMDRPSDKVPPSHSAQVCVEAWDPAPVSTREKPDWPWLALLNCDWLPASSTVCMRVASFMRNICLFREACALRSKNCWPPHGNNMHIYARGFGNLESALNLRLHFICGYPRQSSLLQRSARRHSTTPCPAVLPSLASPSKRTLLETPQKDRREKTVEMVQS